MEEKGLKIFKAFIIGSVYVVGILIWAVIMYITSRSLIKMAELTAPVAFLVFTIYLAKYYELFTVKRKRTYPPLTPSEKAKMNEQWRTWHMAQVQKRKRNRTSAFPAIFAALGGVVIHKSLKGK
jgi:hypothetical protein